MARKARPWTLSGTRHPHPVRADVPGTVRRILPVALAILAMLATLPASAGPPVPAFVEADGIDAPEGHATLHWTYEGDERGVSFQLEQASDESFADARVRYVGPDEALFVSGLIDGETWFRVRAVVPGGDPSRWSEPVAVRVDYPSRERVLLLLGTGCVVFIGTALAIVVGWRREG